MTTDAPPPSRVDPALHLLLYAAAAIALAFTPAIHRLHTADSLIPVLNSLYVGEPFFWEQDRVGMIWPLLVSPLSNPFANLIAQTAAVLFCTLAAPLLLGLVLFRQPGAAPLAAALVNLWILATYPDLFVQNHMVSSYHSSAVVLGCAGLLLLRPDAGWLRMTAAAVLVIAAHWAYVAIAVFLLPVALVRGWVNPGDPGRWWLTRPFTDPRSLAGVMLCLAGLGAGYGLMLAVPSVLDHGFKTSSASVPVNQWLETGARLLEQPARVPGSALWLGGLALAGIGGLAATLVCRQRERWAMAAATALAAAGLAECAAMATREWVAVNLCHPRYILGTCSAFHLAAAVLVAAPLANWAAGRGRWVLLAALAVGLAAVIPERFGTPSATAVRAVHRDQFGRFADDVRRAHADALAGDYWTVWPAVLQINMDRYDRGEPPVLGIAPRGRPWLRQWTSHCPLIRIAVPSGRTARALDRCSACGFSPYSPQFGFSSVEVYLAAQPICTSP